MAVDPSVSYLYNNNKKKSRDPEYAAVTRGRESARATILADGTPTPRPTTSFYNPPNYVRVEDLKYMTEAQVAYLQAILAERDYIAGDYDPGHWDDKTIEGVRDAILVARYEGRTLWELLTPSKATEKAMMESTSSGLPSGSGYDGPITVTDTAVRLSSRTTARAVLTGALQTKLGRSPTKAEVDSFLKALNVKERNNPVTTTTTTSPDGKHDTARSTVTEGGLDPTVYAETYAEKENKKEAKRYDTGHYMELINSMLGV